MTGNITIDERGTVGRRIAANTGLMVGAKAAAAALGLVSLIVTTRSLPIADVGIILFLHAYMLVFAEVATFQSWQAVIRFGTPDIEDGNTPSLLRLLRFCIALDFVGALAAFVLAGLGLLFLGALLPVLPAFDGAAGAQNIAQLKTYGIWYCLLILVHQGGASTGLFRLFDQFKPLAIQTLFMPTGRLAFVILAAVQGWGLAGFLVAWFIGSFAGYIGLPLLALAELRRRKLARPLFSKWPGLKIRREGVWPFVWKANIDSSLAAGTFHLPVLLVMPIFGAAYVSIYKVADDIAKLLAEGLLLLDRVIYPEYARMITRGQAAHIWRIVVKTAALLLGGSVLMIGIYSLIGPWIIKTAFGPQYGGAFILSVLLAFGAALMGVLAPLYPVFYAAGKPQMAIYARGVGLAAYIALVFALSALLGETGPAWAVIGGNILAVVLAAVLVKRTLTQHKTDQT